MAVDDQLLARARHNPAGLAFAEATPLAKQLGWHEVRVRGSHRIFHHPLVPSIKDRSPQPLNLQEGKDGEAKSYQVRQMIQIAIEMGVLTGEERKAIYACARLTSLYLSCLSGWSVG
jgi:hypothetical protein